MAVVLHRTTRQLLRSVNTPDYPEADWIINPDLRAVAGFASKYWIITGDDVSLMSQAQRDAVDADEIEAARDALAAQFDGLEDLMRAFGLAVLDEINLHATRVTAILDAIDNANNLGDVKSSVAAIPDVPTRTIDQLKTAVRGKLGS